MRREPQGCRRPRSAGRGRRRRPRNDDPQHVSCFSEFRDVVFEDVVLDNNSLYLIL